MVARVEDCFLGKAQGLSSQKLVPWKWNLGANQVVQGVRDGEVLNSTSFYGASRSGDLQTWMNPASCMGLAKGQQASSQPHPESDPDGTSALTSLVTCSYQLMAQSQAATTCAAAAPGRAGVTTSAPGLARNPSFESINNTGSCSTPSFCVGSPATVFPSHPCDSGSKDSASDVLLLNEQHAAVQGAYSGSREPQLSDHSLSNDSLSYGGSMDQDRDTIVNCVDAFWNPQDMISDALFPEFRFEPMLDDTADTGACPLSFSVGELDSLVPTSNHGPNLRSIYRGLPPPVIHTAAPDFCQSFLVGTVDEAAEIHPMVASSSILSANHANKPTQLAIPAKHSLLAAFNASSDHPGRLRWSDQPWLGPPHGSATSSSQFTKPEKLPTSLAGSSPSSPTTPLDPHLFASSLQCPSSAGSSISPAIKTEELQKKLSQFNVNSSSNSNSNSNTNTNSNKRSFTTMQMPSQNTVTAAESPYARSIAKVETALQGGANADKFDAAALSALLYSNTQSNQDFYSFKDNAAATPPAPKQRRRHGTATDPQSIAARTRREKFTDRIRILQSLVPNGERLDTVHMLSQTFEYVRFLQHKVWDLYNGKDSLSEVKCEKWKEFVDTTTGQVIV